MQKSSVVSCEGEVMIGNCVTWLLKFVLQSFSVEALAETGVARLRSTCNLLQGLKLWGCEDWLVYESYRKLEPEKRPRCTIS
jgi:hypothetical protein